MCELWAKFESEEVLPPDKQLGERGSSLSGGQRQRLGTQPYLWCLVVNVIWGFPFGPFMVIPCCDLTRSHVISWACFRLAIARAIARGHLVCLYTIWETGKSVDGGVFMWGALLSWKWLQNMEIDMVNYQKRYLATIQLVHLYLFLKLFLCFQGLASPKATPLAIPFWYINAHKSIPSCRVPAVDAWEKISWCPPYMACIEQEPIIWTCNHEHRQLQFNIYFWLKYCIIPTCPKHCKAI